MFYWVMLSEMFMSLINKFISFLVKSFNNKAQSEIFQVDHNPIKSV